MKSKSPLFISSIELVAHSVELLRMNDDKKYKFIILHLANSIELIFKDKLINIGESIYLNNSNKTIGIWESIKELQKNEVDIPEKAILELLIDDRNTIQHRFGHPNKESIYFYLDNVVQFFKRFLKEEYKLEFKDELSVYLDIAQLEFLGLVGDERIQLDKLKNFSIDLAIIQGLGYLESEFWKLSRRGYKESVSRFVALHSDFLIPFLEILSEKGYIQGVSEEDVEFIKVVRNQLVHGQFDSSDFKSTENLNKAYKIVLKLVEGFDKAKKDGFFDEFDWDLVLM